jgi:hypothetical protein
MPATLLGTGEKAVNIRQKKIPSLVRMTGDEQIRKFGNWPSFISSLEEHEEK